MTDIDVAEKGHHVMRVFVTGASGWIGSAVVDELLAAGHEVVGLARSDASAAALEAKGAVVRRGDLDDLDGIRAGAQDAEAVIHLANKHDWSNLAASNAAERNATQAIGDALAGTGRPFLLAAGVAALAQGRPATEADPSPFHGPDSPRGGSENLALEFVDRGVHTVSLRFSPTVHGAATTGSSPHSPRSPARRASPATPATGRTAGPPCTGPTPPAWSRSASRRHRQAPACTPSPRRASPTREIAEAIGRAFDLPVASVAPDDVKGHFGWIGGFFGMDLSATSAATRELLGWTPTGPTLIEDLDAGAYRSGGR